MEYQCARLTCQEVLYGATNPPRSLSDLSNQLRNYYTASNVHKIEKLYGVPDLSSDGSKVELPALQSLYGKMVADGQVYIPSRMLVNALTQRGVDMSRILRYRISWRPAGTSRISLFS